MTTRTTPARCLCWLAGTIGAASAALAQDGPARVIDVPTPTTRASAESGERFSSVEAGIALTLPPGEATADAQGVNGDANLLAVVVDAQNERRFELRRVAADRPTPLVSEPTPEGGTRGGMIDQVVRQLAVEAGPGGRMDVLRRAVTPLADAGAGRAGVVAARYRAGPAGLGSPTLLRQTAVVPVGEAPATQFFRLDLVSPAPDAEDPAAVAGDPRVVSAVGAFTRVLDSLEVVDQTALYEDQRDRLLRTRSLLVNLKVRGRIASAAAGDQWWRVVRDGEDVGVMRVIEEPADGLPGDVGAGFDPGERAGAVDPTEAAGVRVGVRLRMRTADPGVTIDRRTWSYAGRELDQGDFRESNALYEAGDGEATPAAAGVVVGQMRERRVPRPVEVVTDAGLRTRQVIGVDTRRELTVTHTLDGAIRGEPLRRELPPWYLPGAVDHLLPRLLAPWGADSYLVAVYAPGRREVMNKYVDVAGPALVTPPGAAAGDLPVRAFTVTTRLGVGGDPTVHYVAAEGYRWLGSVDGAGGTSVIPSTRDEVDAIWRGTPMIEE